jgi:hypothetical protein
MDELFEKTVCATFIRQGFLEDLKAIGIFGPIRYFVWWFGK